MTTADPTQQSLWGPVWRLLRSFDNDIARLYVERGIEGVRPRFVGPLIRLGREGPMTIRQLADSLQVTHSGMSQTVSTLRQEGLVRTEPGADARTQVVTLTDQGRQLIPLLEAEWRATERTLAELEAEIPYPLSQVVRDLEAALARRPFFERLTTNLERELAER